jgi:serralysin
MQEFRNLQQRFTSLDQRLASVSKAPGDAGSQFDYRVLSADGFDTSFSGTAAAFPLVLPEAADIAGNDTTTTSIAIGGTVQSSIEVSGDHDWIRVELVAGETYQFALTGTGSGALGDPFLHLRNSAGNAVASNDDGGSGLNSLINFTATTSGTYYLDAHAYSNETGTYRLTASQSTPPPPESVTDSIDWGTQVSGSAFTVYFATAGQRFDGETAAEDWSAVEKAAALAAFGVYADVANITFAETSSKASATFVLVKASMAADTLGYFNPPGEANAGIGVFNHTSSTWTNQGLQPGGYAFVTLVHEFGHGLGLAHPHDDGGTSTVMRGVTASFDSYGTAGLNQGVFTTMSYNDGWATGPNGVGSANGYGWQGSLGPLDIALIQQKYGANTNHNGGNTTYQIANANAAGTMYRAIWDTAGTDAIAYSGSRNAVIDLRAATILDAAGGGGYVSYVTGIIGGFTIANGVVIENASGGSGNDTLTGNGAANILTGNGGNDTINGGGGDDIVVFSGNQADYTVTDNSGGSWTVRDLRGGSPDGTDTLTGVETLRFADGDYGATPPPPDGSVINGDGGANTLDGTAGNDTINAGGGADRVTGRAGNDIINGEAGNDTLFGHEGDDTIDGGSGRDVVRGGDGADTINGGSGRDNLRGDAGNDVLRGASGNDTLQGGDGDDIGAGHGGNDRFIGGAGDDRFNGGSGNADSAEFSGNFADYQLDYLAGNGEVRVTDLRAGSPDGMDRLFNVEVLQFANGSVDINGGSFDFTVGAAPVTGVDLAGDAASSKSGDPVMDILNAPAMSGEAPVDFASASAGPLSAIGRVPVELLSLQTEAGGIEPAPVRPGMDLQDVSGVQFVSPPADWLVDLQGWTPLDAAGPGPELNAAAAGDPALAVLNVHELALFNNVAITFATDDEFASIGQDEIDGSGWM